MSRSSGRGEEKLKKGAKNSFSGFLGSRDVYKSVQLDRVCPRVPKDLGYVIVICHCKSSLSSLEGGKGAYW